MSDEFLYAMDLEMENLTDCAEDVQSDTTAATDPEHVKIEFKEDIKEELKEEVASPCGVNERCASPVSEGQTGCDDHCANLNAFELACASVS
jgi:hypothetical protein